MAKPEEPAERRTMIAQFLSELVTYGVEEPPKEERDFPIARKIKRTNILANTAAMMDWSVHGDENTSRDMKRFFSKWRVRKENIEVLPMLGVLNRVCRDGEDFNEEMEILLSRFTSHILDNRSLMILGKCLRTASETYDKTRISDLLELSGTDNEILLKAKEAFMASEDLATACRKAMVSGEHFKAVVLVAAMIAEAFYGRELGVDQGDIISRLPKPYQEISDDFEFIMMMS